MNIDAQIKYSFGSRNPVWRIAVMVLTALLVMNCSYTVMPKNVPLVKGNEGSTFAGISVLITNAEKNGSDAPIPTDRKRNSPFKADRQAWAKKLVESLAREVAMRGALVRSNAPVILGVALPEITFIETKERYQFKAKALVTSSSGWSKNYEAASSVDASRVFSVAEEADRLAGQVISEIVKAIIADAEFMTEIKRP